MTALEEDFLQGIFDNTYLWNVKELLCKSDFDVYWRV